jgi:hypothetical protein
VSTRRNVREDSVFKFVYDNQLIDNILEVYTTDQLFQFLKKFRYEFNTDNAEDNKTKGKHLETLKNYFGNLKEIKEYGENPKDFDRDFMVAIANKIKELQNG